MADLDPFTVADIDPFIVADMTIFYSTIDIQIEIKTLLQWQIEGPFYCGRYRDPLTMANIETLLP